VARAWNSEVRVVFGLLASLSVTHDASAEILYTVEDATDTLCRIDTATGAVTPVGPLGVSFEFGDLAYDVSTATMYMTDGGSATVSSKLYRVDLITGAATAIGSLGTGNASALVYDPARDELFAARSGQTGWFGVDRSTGAATWIGDPGVSVVAATYVASTGSIVALREAMGSLHVIDPATGASALLMPGSPQPMPHAGLAWGAASDRIFALDLASFLTSYDPLGRSCHVAMSLPGYFDGLASVDPPCLPTSTYCTAGTSTGGCTPTVTASGVPSIAATSGFTLSVAGLDGLRSSALFYGASGQVSVPWASGSTSFLCVRPPLQRTGLQSSGGTAAACDGAIALDWLAYLSAHPTALGSPLSIGRTFDAQGWYRDPAASKGSNLSNAFHWAVCP
jgi:hypothetical protein